MLITDDGPAVGDTVSIDGQTAELYIHEPLKITGYAGAVSAVSCAENDKVSASTKLFTLTDTSSSANYESILKQRTELEETLRTLIELRQTGTVNAPVEGTIESAAEDGAAGEETSALFTIDPDEQMTVQLAVDETNVLSLELGQEAEVSVSSAGDDSYTGTVTQIDTAAVSAEGVTEYTATITLDKQEGMLAGMTASVSITIEGVEDALLLPEEAVKRTSSAAYVYTEYDENTGELGGMTEVSVGLDNGSYIEITEGLSEGDTVYYTPVEEENTGGMTGGFGGMRGESPGGEFPSDAQGAMMPSEGGFGGRQGGMPQGE